MSKTKGSKDSVKDALVADIFQGLQVLQRNGVRGADGEIISDAELMDRARNIAGGLIGNYEIKPLPPLVISSSGVCSIGAA